MQPITFAPIYHERVWGGRELERVYHRLLPTPDRPYGESWELVDREEAQSVVDHGPHQGLSLNALWSHRREEIFGRGLPDVPRFPILLKILDARDDLSIQVHPPAELAAELGGEPKTEMWVIAECAPGANLHVGIQPGVDRGAFERAIHEGTVASCVHSIKPAPGESIFIPSGRLHAIGAGFLIHEIQQNSDTTFRVFDWNRPGLDGKPRELHVEASLRSIDFNDTAPTMDAPQGSVLAECPHFKTERVECAPADLLGLEIPDQFAIISVMSGRFRSAEGRSFHSGSTLLLPANAGPLTAGETSIALRITLPGHQGPC